MPLSRGISMFPVMAFKDEAGNVYCQDWKDDRKISSFYPIDDSGYDTIPVEKETHAEIGDPVIAGFVTSEGELIMSDHEGLANILEERGLVDDYSGKFVRWVRGEGE